MSTYPMTLREACILARAIIDQGYIVSEIDEERIIEAFNTFIEGDKRK